MSEEIKMSDVLLRAAEVVMSRDGDTTNEDGSFACVDIDSIIHLESQLSRLFSLDCDDIIRSDLPLLKDRAKKYDRLIEENKRLRDMLNRLVSHDNCRKDVIHLMSEADSLLSELNGE